MHARVATFEGGDPDTVQAMVSDLNQRSRSGPPDGIPAVGLLVLHRSDGSQVLNISLFETEADMEQGDATLNSMDPPTAGGLGERTSVEMYEVGVNLRPTG